MTRQRPESKPPADAQESAGLELSVDPRAPVRLDVGRVCEIRQEVRIGATPAIVFAFLTDSERMMIWLARDVAADARPGGVFRLADFNGLWIEGTYLEVIAHRTVVFTWGGFEGLRVGQSTVEFGLDGDDKTTLVQLRHFGLSDSAGVPHHFLWKNSGLPKLKAAAEGRDTGAPCLSEIADLREQRPYSWWDSGMHQIGDHG